MWRNASLSDLEAIIRLARAVHPLFPEDEVVFANRLAVWPQGCFVFVMGEEIGGYALTHPWAGDPPKLNTLVERLPSRGEFYYIHDVALASALRGRGAGQALMPLLDALCAKHNLPVQRLVAVGKADLFWKKVGFMALPKRVDSAYGVDACLMERSIA